MRVTYGQQTSDEMAELWFQVVPRDPQQRAALTRSLYAKVLPEEINGRQMMLAKDPGNVALHDDLALMYVEAGRMASAIEEFKASLKLRPDLAAARLTSAPRCWPQATAAAPVLTSSRRSRLIPITPSRIATWARSSRLTATCQARCPITGGRSTWRRLMPRSS